MVQPGDDMVEAQRALRQLLDGIGGTDWLDSGAVAFGGEEPELGSPHRMVAASAAALAATAAGAARRWHRATGVSQRIDIDALHAACGLCSNFFQRQNGHALPPLSLQRELKADFYPTSDGRWFYLTGSYHHLRDGVLELLDCANTKVAIGKAVQGRHSSELEEAFFARGLTGAIVHNADEWRQHRQGRWLSKAPVIAIERIGDSAAEPPRSRRRPLDDLRVLDAAHVIAGPVAARTLAEHGAQVLRVSSPRQPDPVLQVLDTGIGKRNAYIDFGSADDAARLRELVRRADVFVQSWKPSSLERAGFGPAALAALRPGLIYLSVSAYGDGPWAERKGFDQIAQASSGVAMTEGGGERPRLVPTHLLNDYLSAYLGAAGVMAALERRAVEGGSYHVKVSLCRTAMWVQDLGLRKVGDGIVHIDRLKPLLVSQSSPFGVIERMDPVARMSATPTHWTLPPAPLGAHMPAWLD